MSGAPTPTSVSGGPTASMTLTPTFVATVASLAVATSATLYLVYQQRDTLFGNKGYSNFERKYAAKLKASRQQVDAAREAMLLGSADGTTADELEMSSLATVKVIYGSDSGNAEAFAKGLVMTLNDRGVSAALIDPSRWAYLDRYMRQNPKLHTLFQFPQRAEAATATATAGPRDVHSADVSPATSPAPMAIASSADTSAVDSRVGVGAAPTVTGRSGTPRRSTKAEESFCLEDEGALQQEVLLFVVATAGEGEPTANFQTLFQEMQLAASTASAGQAALPTQRHAVQNAAGSGSPASHTTARGGAAGGTSSTDASPATDVLGGPVFAHVKYAVFALGDSSYKYYCRAAITVNTLMKSGGAQELLPIGFGDARDGFGKQEESFDDWQDGVMEALVERCGIQLTAGSMNPPRPRMTYVTFPPSSSAFSLRGGPLSTEEARGGGDVDSACREKEPFPTNGCTGPAPFPPPPPLFEPSQHRPSLIRLTRKEQLTPTREDDGSAVYRFTFTTEGTNITYQAGDHLGIFPTNPPAVVDRCAALLGLSEADLAVEVELQEARTRTAMRNTLPARVTLRTALSCYTDLCGRPKKSALRVLAKYCTDSTEKKAFLKAIDAQRAGVSQTSSFALSAPSPLHRAEGGGAASIGSLPPSPAKSVTGSRAGDEKDSDGARHASSEAPRTVLDYMEKYRSCCGGAVPVGHFLEVLPRIQPRFYSVATDRTTHPQEIQIYVRVLPNGLASDYLANRVVACGGEHNTTEYECSNDFADGEHASPIATDDDCGTERREVGPPRQQRQYYPNGQRHDERWRDASLVFAYVRFSTFHLPASLSPTAPVLLIGPGTGAAAMVGLLYRREALMRRNPTTVYGDCFFFFGARHAKEEFFIREEVTRWSMEPVEMAMHDDANPEARIAAAMRHAKDKRRLSSRVLTLLECAFSRDGPDKVYVTDLINRHADYIYDMIMNNKESMIFLSGDAAAMAKDVDRVLVSLIQTKGKKGRLSALKVLQNMESELRYLKDVY